MTGRHSTSENTHEPRPECPQHGLDQDTIQWLFTFGLCPVRDRTEAALGHVGGVSLWHRARVEMSGHEVWHRIKFPPEGSRKWKQKRMPHSD